MLVSKNIFQLDLASDDFFEDNSNIESKSNESDSLNSEPSLNQDEEKQYDRDNLNRITNNSTTTIIDRNVGEQDMSGLLANVEISQESAETFSTCANTEGRY